MLHHLKNVVDVSKDNTIPILTSVWLDGERAVGTDLDMLLEVPCSVDGLSAPLAVPLAPLLKLKDPSLSDEGDDKLTARKDGLTLKLDTLPAEDFPVSQASGFQAAFDGANLLDIFRRLAPCIANEETRRYYLNGVYLDVEGGELHAVAIDGHKLGHFLVGPAPDGMPNADIIIPRKAVHALLRMKSEIVSVEIAPAYIRFHLDGGAILTTKLIDAKYPDWRRFITEKQDSCLTVDRKAMLDACKKLKKLGLHGTVVTLCLNDGGSTLAQDDSCTGKALIDIFTRWNGTQDLRILFNIDYLIELLSVIDGDSVQFNIRDQRSPVLIDGAYVLMPMRWSV